MYYYVYRTTNTTTGKIYVGKHTSATHPSKNGYYGSGKLLLEDIKRYGKECFTKEVIEWCSSSDEAAKVEASIVTPEFVRRVDTYNMHRGGNGGFDHINSIPPSERINLLVYKEKRSRGLITTGGTQHWTADSRDRAVQQGKRNREEGIAGGNTWGKLSDTKRLELRRLAAERISGTNNPTFGTRLYIDAGYSGSYNIRLTQRYIPGQQPTGWVTTTEWRDARKRKSGGYGKAWFNDGVNNFFIDPLTAHSELTRGRLGRIGESKTA